MSASMRCRSSTLTHSVMPPLPPGSNRPPALELCRLVRSQEQALVLAQRFLDLAVRWQGGLVGDPEPLRRLAPGLVVIAQAALGHQAGGLVRHLLATLAAARHRVDLGVCVVAAVSHRGDPPGDIPTLPDRRAAFRRCTQKMSKASSVGRAS